MLVNSSVIMKCLVVVILCIGNFIWPVLAWPAFCGFSHSNISLRFIQYIKVLLFKHHLIKDLMSTYYISFSLVVFARLIHFQMLTVWFCHTRVLTKKRNNL